MFRENQGKGIGVFVPGCEVQRRTGEIHFQCSNLCNHEPRDRTLPLKSSHSSACPYFHYSHSKFSPSDLLKTNIPEFQQARLGVCSSCSYPYIPKLFPSAAHKVDRPLVLPEHPFISLAFLSNQLWEFHYYLCKMSETISIPSLCSSHFHLQSGKKQIHLVPESVHSHGAHTTGAKSELAKTGSLFQSLCSPARKASRNMCSEMISARSLFRLWIALKGPNFFGLNQLGK